MAAAPRMSIELLLIHKGQHMNVCLDPDDLAKQVAVDGFLMIPHQAYNNELDDMFNLGFERGKEYATATRESLPVEATKPARKRRRFVCVEIKRKRPAEGASATAKGIK